MVTFFGSLFSWQDFTPSQFSTGLFRWWEFMLLHAFNNLHVCWTLNPCLVSQLLGAPYKCYVGQRLGYYKRFLLARIIKINPCLMCDLLAVIYKCFAYTYMLYVSVRSETGHFCIHSFLLAKPLLMLIYSRLLYLMCASAGLMSWMTSEFHSYAYLEVYVYVL